MNPIFRNIVALVVGWAVGSAVNGGLISLGHAIFPPPFPEGADPNDFEAFKAAMEMFELKDFVFPFLAHALGTLVGAILAGWLAATHKMKFSIAIGAVFFIGGFMMVMMVPAPLWFDILDLTLAYFPMGLLGGYIALKLAPPSR